MSRERRASWDSVDTVLAEDPFPFFAAAEVKFLGIGEDAVADESWGRVEDGAKANDGIGGCDPGDVEEELGLLGPGWRLEIVQESDVLHDSG